MVEKHDHADGPCDLPDPFDAFAFSRATTRCRREFVYTGTATCCCRMCHNADYPDRTEPQRRRRERRRTKVADRNWMTAY
jgi:hypothetical protein